MRSVLLLSLLTLLTPCSRSRAETRYYFLLFAYQGTSRKPSLGHSIGTFVKVRHEKDRCEILHAHTISWLPETLNVRLKAILPEKGRNLGLEESLDLALKLNARIWLWGPFEIKEKLYERSCRQIKKLESGKVKYKAFDFILPTSTCSNCVHALSDLALMLPRPRVLAFSWGKKGSYRVLRRLRWFVVDLLKTHDWLIDALNLRRYPLIRVSATEKVGLLPIPIK